jgi:hypothetical protein
MTLTEKVYAVLGQEQSHGEAALATANRYPKGDALTELDLDCRDWGFVFGFAYGIARGEDTYEPEASVLDRAEAAARDAYARWAGADIFTSEAYDKDRAERRRRGEIEVA